MSKNEVNVSIPSALRGKTFGSFGALGSAVGIEQKSQKTINKKCPKCGTRMNQVPGTNVFFCPGETDDGPCGKRVISNLRPAY